MLDAPWPPPHDGPQQPRDAHARAWTADVRRAAPPPASASWWPADAPGGALPRRASDGHARDGQARDRRAPDGHARDAHARDVHRADGWPAPGAARPRPHATWLPEPAWIPQPSPAPEQRWTPEQDWVATFARRAPAADLPADDGPGRAARWLVGGAVAAVVVPLLVLAVALGL
ncbi:hypothetical protein AB6N23_16030 [Cellulomonas sp. 179-A 9B4 NHS]|uniref:hypothetical protein n=1 Tax=Cellulomonas sp. 179-A 9B4 NHS TaxID=3142379 RepID=UPI0039A082C5